MRAEGATLRELAKSIGAAAMLLRWQQANCQPLSIPHFAKPRKTFDPMSAWETKDIVVVASSAMSLVGTIVVQLMQHVFAARRERSKALESVRRDLYQGVIANLDTAINELAHEEHPQFKAALDRARKILENNPLNISERFHAACRPFAFKEWFDEDMEVDRHNTGGVETTVRSLVRTRDKLLSVSLKELRIRQPTFYHVTKPLSAMSRTIRRIRVKRFMYRLSRKSPARIKDK